MEEIIKTVGSSAGFAGVILIYFIYTLLPGIREEARLVRDDSKVTRDRIDKLTEAVNIFSRVQALRIATNHDVHPEAREAAEEIIREIDSSKARP